jgi:hypothetical protein
LFSGDPAGREEAAVEGRGRRRRGRRRRGRRRKGRMQGRRTGGRTGVTWEWMERWAVEVAGGQRVVRCSISWYSIFFIHLLFFLFLFSPFR